MSIQSPLILLITTVLVSKNLLGSVDYYAPHPFGTQCEYALGADEVTSGKWWLSPENEPAREKSFREWICARPRDKALAFAIYTHNAGTLKLTAQCFPLLPEEPTEATLELLIEGNSYHR